MVLINTNNTYRPTLIYTLHDCTNIIKRYQSDDQPMLQKYAIGFSVREEIFFHAHRNGK